MGVGDGGILLNLTFAGRLICKTLDPYQMIWKLMVLEVEEMNFNFVWDASFCDMQVSIRLRGCHQINTTTLMSHAELVHTKVLHESSVCRYRHMCSLELLLLFAACSCTGTVVSSAV